MKLNMLKNKKRLLTLLLSCSIYGQSMAMDNSWQMSERLLGLQKTAIMVLGVDEETCGAALNCLCTNALKTADALSDIPLILLDSIDLANQCHLNALLVVLLAQNNTLNENTLNLARTYLALNLLRPYPILALSTDELLTTGQDHITKLNLENQWVKWVTQHLATNDKIQIFMQTYIWNKKQCKAPLCTQIRQRLNYVRLALVQELLKEYLPKNLNSHLWKDQPNAIDNVMPKIVGIDIFIKAVNGLKIPVLLSCINGKGHRSSALVTPDLSGLSEDNINPKAPVIVIHGKSSSDKDIKTIIKELDVKPEDLIYAIAACWMKKYQPLGVKAIKRDLYYSDLYDKWLNRTEKYDVSYEKNTNTHYVIEHIYPDTYGHATEKNN